MSLWLLRIDVYDARLLIGYSSNELDQSELDEDTFEQ